MLDYALWHSINLKMREQEAQWPADKKETADEFKARLRRTALGLPESLVKRCVGNMVHRCRALWNRKGGLFTEGHGPSNL